MSASPVLTTCNSLRRWSTSNRHTIGELHILRSFDAANRRIADLRHRMIGVWLVAVLAGLALTYLLARRILRPVQELDQAASEIGRRN